MTSSRPWLSVLIPTYNGEAFLRAALSSIEMQRDEGIECIAVDDGSNDGTVSILHEYQQRIPLVVEQRARIGNWVQNTNLALSMSRGDYVCLLHQDDIWLEARLSRLRPLLQQYRATLLLTPADFIDAQGRRLGQWRCPLPALPRIPSRDRVLGSLLVQNFIPLPAPIFTREDALAVGGLDDQAWYTADWDFWLKLAECGRTVYYPNATVGFRIHPHSQTVLRSASHDDFQEQLQSVAGRHLAFLDAPSSTRQKVHRLSDFSNQVNADLAGALHGKRLRLLGLLFSFLGLGPAGGHQYLRDSRIWERAVARIRARIGQHRE